NFCCNEDFAFDGATLYRVHYPDAIYKVDPATGAVLATYSAGDDPAFPSEPVGITFIGDQIWVSRWTSREVGIWDPATNAFTAKFTVPNFAGGLAYDASSGVLWVGQLGGCVEPYDLKGNIQGVAAE